MIRKFKTYHMNQTKHTCELSSNCWSLLCTCYCTELGLRASSWPVFMAPEFRNRREVMFLTSEPSEVKCSLPQSIWMKSRSCKSAQFVPLGVIENKSGCLAHPIRMWLLESISRWRAEKVEGGAAPSDPNAPTTMPPLHPPLYPLHSFISSALSCLLLVTQK